MAIADESLREMTTEQLQMLKRVAGDETVRRIDAELRRRAAGDDKEASPNRRSRENSMPATQSPTSIEAFDVVGAPVRLDWLPPSHNAIWLPVIGKSSGRPKLVLSKKAREWKKYAQSAALQQFPLAPFACELDVRMVVRRGPGARFDVQNLGKLMWDALEGICYVNDRQIRDVDLRVFDVDDAKLVGLDLIFTPRIGR